MNKKDPFQTPFRIKCQLCGTLAESWHASLPIPPGKTAGRGFCECGALAVDSLGHPNKGRVSVTDSRATEPPLIQALSWEWHLGSINGGGVPIHKFPIGAVVRCKSSLCLWLY